MKTLRLNRIVIHGVLKDTTTGKALFNSGINGLIGSRLTINKFSSITTNGAPSLTGKRSGLVKLSSDKIE